MPITSPDSISYPDTSWTGGFRSAMAAMATSIQTALSKLRQKSYSWADQTAKNAQTGMAAGDIGRQVDIQMAFQFDGTAWRPYGVGVFATVAAASLAIPLAQRQQDMVFTALDTDTQWEWLALYNSSTNVGGAAVAGWYPVSGNIPGVLLAKSADQTLTVLSTEYPITFDTELVDRFAMHDNVTNPSRIQIPVSGIWLVEYNIYISSVTGVGFSYIKVNNTTFGLGTVDRRAGANPVGTPLKVSARIPLTAGDYVELCAQDTVAAVVVKGPNNTGTAPEAFGASLLVRYDQPRQA